MARLIRVNSETPTVANNDDFRLLRYATGGYNGVLENYGNECSYTVDGSDFTINSGEIIYQGVDTEILTSGETITIDNIAGTQYYVVYLEIDLSDSGSQTSIIKSSYGTSDYPTISAGDDLTTVPNGVANFILYKFEASSGVISNVVSQFNIVEIGKVLNAENDGLGNKINTTYVKNSDFNNSSPTTFGDYIVEKKILLWNGTLENSSVSNYEYADFTGGSIAIGDILEIVYDIGLGTIVSRFQVKAASSLFEASQGRIWLNSGDYYNYLYQAEFLASVTNQRIGMWGTYFDVIKIPSGTGNVTAYNRSTTTSKLYAVYKIIQ